MANNRYDGAYNRNSLLNDPQYLLAMEMIKGRKDIDGLDDGIASLAQSLAGGFIANKLGDDYAVKQKGIDNLERLALEIMGGQTGVDTESYGDGTTINWRDADGKTGALAAASILPSESNLRDDLLKADLEQRKDAAGVKRQIELINYQNDLQRGERKEARAYQDERDRIAHLGDLMTKGYTPVEDVEQPPINGDMLPDVLPLDADADKQSGIDLSGFEPPPVANRANQVTDPVTGKRFIRPEPKNGRGGSMQIDPETGQLSFVPAEKALTENQANAALFYNRGISSNKILDEFEKSGLDAEQEIKSNIPLVGNFLVSGDRRQLNTAKKNFLTAVLRKESGASIAPSEFETGAQIYFPGPGDDEASLALKREARNDALLGLEIAAGPGANRIKRLKDLQTSKKKRLMELEKKEREGLSNQDEAR